MSPAIGKITAEQAQEAVAKVLRKQRVQRIMPRLAESVVQYAEANCLHIYNVGPWEHKCGLGSWGEWIIPACPEGQEYIEMPKVVPGMYHEPIIKDEKHFMLEPINGADLANEIIGIGKMRNAKLSLISSGVFIGSVIGLKATPTKQELRNAKSALLAKYQGIFQETEVAFGKNPSEGVEDAAIIAATALGRTDVTWMKRRMPGQRQDCPVCGASCGDTVILCGSCGYQFDPEAYAKLVADGRMGGGSKPKLTLGQK